MKIESMGRNSKNRFLAPLGMTVLGLAARMMAGGLALVVRLLVAMGLPVAVLSGLAPCNHRARRRL